MPKVSIVNCDSYDEKKVLRSVKKAINDIGFSFKKGQKVLLKPNILSGTEKEKAVTTHPSIIDALCVILKQNKCDVSIGDSSGDFTYNEISKNLEKCGIMDIVKKHKIKVVCFEKAGTKKFENLKSCVDSLEIAKPVFDADIIINLPKLKTHILTTLTLAVKNLYGTIPGGRKQLYHSLGDNDEKFCEILLDIYEQVMPQLTIMDAVIGLEGNGPGSQGNPKQTGLILGSDNCLALDFIATKIVIPDHDPEEILTNKIGKQRGLIDPDKIEVIGDIPEIPYELATNALKNTPRFIRRYFARNSRLIPEIQKDKCKKCGLCVKVCPTNAMHRKNDDEIPRFAKRKCISCYCCHENCPYNAIDLKKSMMMKFALLIRTIIKMVLRR